MRVDLAAAFKQFSVCKKSVLFLTCSSEKNLHFVSFQRNKTFFIMNNKRIASTSSLNSVTSTKSTRSAGSSSRKNHQPVATSNITTEELDKLNQNLALIQYYNALSRQQKIKEKENNLRKQLEETRTKEEELTALQDELEKIKFQLAKMVLLRESVKMDEKIRDFIERVVAPVTCSASVSLKLSEENFDKFKSLFAFHFTLFFLTYFLFILLDILDTIQTNITDTAGQNLIEQTIKKINTYRLTDNFVSTITDGKIVEDSKVLGQNIEKSVSTIIDIKAEISKYQKLLNNYKMETKENALENL